MNINVDHLRREILKLYPDGKEIAENDVKSRRGPYRFSFEFSCNIGKKKVKVQVALPKSFPLKLPHFFLKDPVQLGFIPHLEKDGYICYTFETGLLLDVTDPIRIIDESWEHVKQTLENGLLNINEDDFYSDFEILWQRQSTTIDMDSFIDPNTKFQRVTVFEEKKKTKKILINKGIKNQLGIIKSFYGQNILDKCKEVPGVYIPLRKGTRIKPPSFEDFWSIKKLRSYIFDNISGSIKRQLNKYLQRKVSTADKFYLFFSIPLQTEVIFVGVCFESGYKDLISGRISHPLIKNKHSFFIQPVSLKRHNKDYLLKRTLGNTDISLKDVAIIGLGSLGSPIAFELARAGVQSLLLIDNDVLDVDNVYRHSLGADMLYHEGIYGGYVPISKVEAMKMKLNGMYPSVEVDYEVADCLEIIEDSFHILKEKDLIIVALGEPTIELYLNKRIYSDDKAPPVIYTWIEPMGIGGHSILTNNNHRLGCLQCLFSSSSEPNTLTYNRSSFVKENQSISKTMLGCGSTFTPYGSIDALQTAILATRLAIQALTNRVDKNPLKSWKGSTNEVLATGLEIVPRFELSTEELLNQQYNYSTSNCPICGGE